MSASRCFDAGNFVVISKSGNLLRFSFEIALAVLGPWSFLHFWTPSASARKGLMALRRLCISRGTWHPTHEPSELLVEAVCLSTCLEILQFLSTHFVLFQRSNCFY